VVGEPGFFYLGFNYSDAIYGQRMDLNGNLYWPTWPGSYGALMWSRPGWGLGGDRAFAYHSSNFYGLFYERPIAGTDNIFYFFLQRLDSLGNRTLGIMAL